MAIQIPKIVFFDMDDTILHDMSMAPQCWEQAFRQFVGGVGGGEAPSNRLVSGTGETWSLTRKGV